jgi:dephospho-CoA kinase
MIIGITGTLGAGKGTVAEYLTTHHKFTYFSVRNFYAGEVVRSGHLANRDTITAIAKALRTEHGPIFAMEQLMLQARPGQNVVIESIRTKAEAQYLKSLGAHLWAIDADIHMRYERSAKRDVGTKTLSFDEFAAQDAGDTGLREAMALADASINCDCSKEELYAEVEKVLARTGFKKESL